MNKTLIQILAGIVIVAAAGLAVYYLATGSVQAPSEQPNQEVQNVQTGKRSPMKFFITSINPGKGADLGGLAGADQYCQTLASNAAPNYEKWHAYLSATATAETAAVNARDRIGSGPWYNFKGELIANNLEELHGQNNITKQTALTEKGEIISGRGDDVNIHDILTGSDPEGRAISGSTDSTCGNWTVSGAEGSAMVGHHDRMGLNDLAPAKSWNSSHLSRGCGLENLKSTGGAGLFYCFAE